MDMNDRQIGMRLRLLREALKIKGTTIFDRSEGAIRGDELSKYEHGHREFRKLEALAKAYGLDSKTLEQVIVGTMSAEQAAALSTVRPSLSIESASMAPTTRRLRTTTAFTWDANDAGIAKASREDPADSRISEYVKLRLQQLMNSPYPQLELAILYNAASGKTWRADAVAAARHGHFDDDVAPKAWEKRLTQLERDLRKLAEKHHPNDS